MSFRLGMAKFIIPFIFAFYPTILIVEQFDIDTLDADPEFARGDTLGWFNMGSTVILLMPPGASDAFAALESGTTVVAGEAIGSIAGK